MPYVSRAQQGYFHVHLPQLAKEYDAASKGVTGLPYHVKKRRKRVRMRRKT